MRILHSSRWISAPHFRMGLLNGLMPVFCSAQPHRPNGAGDGFVHEFGQERRFWR